MARRRHLRRALAALGVVLAGTSTAASVTCGSANDPHAVEPPAATLPAFPGAQGGGALAVGGRGGAVKEVTHLGDSGPGSLRACVEAAGPRTCVFRVAGTITLRTPLRIVEPYLTIAGQSAPGGGVQVVGPFSTGDPASPDNRAGASTIVIGTHDVVIRYLRVRRGLVRGDLCSGAGCDWARCRAGDRQGGACVVGARPDGITLSPRRAANGAVENVILDHVSSQWAAGKALGAWNNAGVDKLRNVTIQWSLAAETLKGHSTALIVGSDNPGVEDTRDISNSITDFDWHHNLLMSSSHRYPLIKAKRARFVSNVVYNWSLYATQIGGGAEVDVVSNLFRPGPMTAAGHEIQVYPWTANATVPSGDPSLFVAGNAGPNSPDPEADGWGRMVYWVPEENGAESRPDAGVLDGSRFRRTEPLPPAGVRIGATRAGAELERAVLPTAGASRRLDCHGRWIAARDALDRRLVSEYETGSGPRSGADACSGPACIPQSEVDSPEKGFPELAPAAPCPDGDHDGMPDAWETAHGLDPRDPRDGARRQGDGYTNLERYLAGEE